MTIWQKISGFATTVGEAGSGCWASWPSARDWSGTGRAAEGHCLHHRRHCAHRQDGQGGRHRVSVEVETFKQVFHSSPAEARNVERVYDLAQQDMAGYEAYADQIAGAAQGRQEAAAARAGGPDARRRGRRHPASQGRPGPATTSPRGFGFSTSEFRFFRARFVTDTGNPYDVLRLGPDATNDEIKAQYRKLVADNHPDKLMGAACRPSSSTSPPASWPPSTRPTTPSPRNAGFDRQARHAAWSALVGRLPTSSRGGASGSPSMLLLHYTGVESAPRPSTG